MRGEWRVWKAIDLVWISGCLALAAAPLDWPYGYYQLLRVMISVIAVFLAIRSWRPGSRAWTWGLAAMALIYNPLAPLSLGRELWTIVNGVSVAVLVMHWWATERQRGAT